MCVYYTDSHILQTAHVLSTTTHTLASRLGAQRCRITPTITEKHARTQRTCTQRPGGGDPMRSYPEAFKQSLFVFDNICRFNEGLRRQPNQRRRRRRRRQPEHMMYHLWLYNAHPARQHMQALYSDVWMFIKLTHDDAMTSRIDNPTRESPENKHVRINVPAIPIGRLSNRHIRRKLVYPTSSTSPGDSWKMNIPTHTCTDNCDRLENCLEFD